MKLFKTFVCFSLLLCSFPILAKVEIFACEPEWKSLAEIVGGEHVEVFLATNALQDPHFVEARPSFIAKTRQADLIICTGGELEVGWLPLLLRQSGNAAIQQNQPGNFLAAEQVERIEIPIQLDRSQGDVHASGNPHVHLDPYRLLTIAKAFSLRLISIDDDHATDYQNNYRAFEAKWKKQIVIWEAQAAPLKGKRVIVSHKSWSYLLNWLGMEVVGDLEPKQGIPPTSAHLAGLLEKIRSTEKVDFILVAGYQDAKGARWLSEKTNIPVINLPFTVGGNEQSTDLFGLFDSTISLLKQPTH